MTNKKPLIPIFFATDDNYVPFMAVAIKSITENYSKDYRYKVHVLNTGISKENRKRLLDLEQDELSIEFNDVSEKINEIKSLLDDNLRDYYSDAIYYRLFIPAMFREYKKAIYIDCDVVLVDDISKMFNVDLKDNLLGSVLDEVAPAYPEFIKYVEDAVGVPIDQYFCSGVLLMNLAALREYKIEEKFIGLLSKYNFGTIAPDQDYLNVMCKNKVMYLHPGWDKQSNNKPYDDELHLIHYNMFMKPWRFKNVPYEEYFWKYAKMTTDFYDDVLEIQSEYTDEKREADKAGAGRMIEMTNAIIQSPVTFKSVLGHKSIEAALKDTRISQIRKKLAEKKEKRKNKKIMKNSQGGAEKAPDRLEVLAKMAEYEKAGKFNEDIENDPLAKELLPEQVDYLRKKLISKIRSKIAFRIAHKFVRKMEKAKLFCVQKYEGLENLSNLKTGAVLTCNHFNPCDSFAVQLAYEKAKTKRKIFRVIKEGNYTSMDGFYGYLMRNCNTLPLSSNRNTMKKFIKSVGTILARGDLVLVYPEQAMWWNYKKPRPMREGAFNFAVKNNVPVVPIFITMEDSDVIGPDGFNIQKYTIHVEKPIYPKSDVPYKDNIQYLMEENAKVWKQIYETTYKEKLTYDTESK